MTISDDDERGPRWSRVPGVGRRRGAAVTADPADEPSGRREADGSEFGPTIDLTRDPAVVHYGPPSGAGRGAADDDHDYVEIRPEAGPVRKGLAILLIFGLVIGAAVGGGYWWYRRQVDPPGPPGGPVAVVIPAGSSTTRIAGLLDHAGVVSNSAVFSFYVGRKHAGTFQAGRFVLRRNSDFDTVIRVLKAGPEAPRIIRVNVPEGLTVAQVESRLHRAVPRFTPAMVQATLAGGQVRSTLQPSGQRSWEGLLYPATYDVGPRTALPALLSEMAAKMETVAVREGLEQQAAAVSARYGIGLSGYQVLTVASLIQEEAGSSAEAPMIATVIYNRLRQGVPLGIDATSRWLAETTGTTVDFTSASPYNTRRQKGLPPTPIAAPSQASLRAALHPADGPWLFYVLTERRKHTFATTNQEFLRAKDLCRARGLGCG